MFLKNAIFGCLCLMGLSSTAMSETYVIDVRTPQEYESDHIHQALNIEYQNILEGVADARILSDDTVMVYCRSGKRAGVAKKTLEDNGFKHVINLGGLEDARAQLGEN